MEAYIATLPVPNPTCSFWLSQPDEDISCYQSTEFCTDVDVVIIGAGLTGAFIAHDLLSTKSPNKPKSVAILEARTSASGASGRNGGHIKPDCYRGFSSYALLHGKDAAVAQCSFEAANHRETMAFIRNNGLENDIHHVEYRSADVYMSQKAWENGLKSYNGFKNAGGDVSQLQILDKAEAEETLRVKNCFGAITYPASSLWPYKLAIRVLQKSLDLGLLLYTNTPVEGIMPVKDEQRWKLQTSRGDVITNKVIHATNGYASYLLPELAGRIIPLKGHVAAIVPPETYDKNPLSTSFAFLMDEDYDYLIQRPGPVKHLIWGGGEIAHPGGLTAGFGDCDDSTVTAEVLSYIRRSPGRIFRDWNRGDTEEDIESRADYEWSGIMGISKDSLPFLGAVPGKTGQYLAAGYHGHGMARVFLSVKGFCQYFRGERIDPRIPAPCFDLNSRLKEPINMALIDDLV